MITLLRARPHFEAIIIEINPKLVSKDNWQVDIYNKTKSYQFFMSIFALATAPGTSGLAVIRVSGNEAFKVAQTLTKFKNIRHEIF